MNLCKFIIPINMNHLLFFRKSCWLALLAFVMIGMPGCSGDDTENPRTDMPEIEPTTRDVRICLSEVKLGTRTSISGSESDTPELVWNDGDPVSYAVSLDGEILHTRDAQISLSSHKLHFFAPEGASCNRTAHKYVKN